MWYNIDIKHINTILIPVFNWYQNKITWWYYKVFNRHLNKNRYLSGIWYLIMVFKWYLSFKYRYLNGIFLDVFFRLEQFLTDF